MTIEPALTSEEWERFLESGHYISEKGVISDYVDGEMEISLKGAELPDGERSTLAALTLHEQEFGFTWEDVWNLRNILNVPLEVLDLADRIAALLPPREEDNA